MPIKFTFLILPHFHSMDLAGPDQTILEAIDYGADFKIEYCTMDESTVSSAGLPLGSMKHFSEVQLTEGDFLIIPGSSVSYLISPKFKKNIDLIDWIVQQHHKKINLVSICAGAFVLAECGLLDYIECTTHFKRTIQLQQLYPKARVKENILFVEENGIYTSAGIAAGIDLLLHIIEKIKGSLFAHKVARELVIYIRREGSGEQQSIYLRFRNHIHSGIHKVQDFIVGHIDQKNNLTDLAELAGMSERNFTRVFKKETGITVNNYITSVRVENIKNLLNNPDFSRKQIAQKVGLESEKQLQRIMKAKVSL
jgi:transcriptional regulator GlxA family with amidase domain